jgi:hypothetical protein
MQNELPISSLFMLTYIDEKIPTERISERDFNSNLPHMANLEYQVY